MESIVETSCLSDDVKESVTNDFSWIRDEAFQEIGGRDYEDQTDLARCMEDVAKGILRKLGLPTETEANLDLDVDELPGDPVDLCRAIWDEATGMMIWGLAASPFCARKILHLARAVEQWHEAAGTNQLRRVAPGSEPGSSFTEMTRRGLTQVTEAFGTWTGDSVRNESSAGVRIEQLDVIEEETSEGSALLFCNEDERRAIVKEIQGASAPSTKEFNKGATEFVPGKPRKTPEVGKVAPEVASKSLRIDAAEFVPTVAARAAAEVPQATLPTPLFPVPQMPVPATLPFQDFGAAWTAQESKANGKTSNIAMKPDAQEFFPGVSAWAGAIVMPKQKAKAKAKASTARPRHPTSPGFIPSQPMSPGLQPTTRDADTAAPSLGSSGAVFAETPLHSLVSSPRCTLEAVEFLLHHGADVAARDKHNGTPLYLAAQWGHKEVVDLLIRHGADVAACDNYNKTPLHVAAEQGHKEVVDLLIQRGADVAARAKYLGTPLHFAADRGHKEVVDLLIERGADVAACGNENRTLLHLAAEWGHTEVVARDKLYDRTPLHWAAWNGHTEVVDLLIRHGADVAARDTLNRTLLHLAAEWGHKEVVDLLIRHGTDVAACDNYNKTPLHVAATCGHKEVVDLLIQRGADVAARAKYLGTPLHFAADRGHKEVVDLLIQRGADVAACGNENRTPLHEAAMSGHKEVVDWLIRHGADVAACDNYNKTPLHEADMRRHKEVVDLLIQRGADVAARADDNRTLLHVTAMIGYKEVVDLLIQRGARYW